MMDDCCAEGDCFHSEWQGLTDSIRRAIHKEHQKQEEVNFFNGRRSNTCFDDILGYRVMHRTMPKNLSNLIVMSCHGLTLALL